MKRAELMKLANGTIIDNGHYEGVIRTACGQKVIEVYIPVEDMWNEAPHFDDKPEYWEVIV